jgi:hypothetical protein
MSERPIGERVAVLEVRVDVVQEEVEAMKTELLPAQGNTIKALADEMREVQKTLTERKRDLHWLGTAFRDWLTPLMLGLILWSLTHR